MHRTKDKKFENNKFLAVISDYWMDFKRKYPGFNTPHYNSAVRSILHCADPEFGFKQYMCLHCGQDSRIVAHSCKSRLCLRCGRVDGENFALLVADKLHQDVNYRHLVLTIPAQLRSFFYSQRQNNDLFNRFFAAGWECVQAFMTEVMGEETEPGCLIVVHTVGRKCDYKPHLHIMLMSGGISVKNGQWLGLDRFPYRILTRCWKRILLKMFREWDSKGANENLFAALEARYKGFVANIDSRDAPTGSRQLVRYLSKYICRPQISLKRLLQYSPENGEVVYCYKSHSSGKQETEKISSIDFIGRMMQQLLPKGFQKIRYYGLQSNQYRSRLRAKVCVALGKLELIQERAVAPVRIARMSYQSLVEIWWRYDPFRCTKCGELMELVRIWNPRKGLVFCLFRDLFGEDIGPPGILPAFMVSLN
jgi:hypothetical protein